MTQSLGPGAFGSAPTKSLGQGAWGNSPTKSLGQAAWGAAPTHSLGQAAFGRPRAQTTSADQAARQLAGLLATQHLVSGGLDDVQTRQMRSNSDWQGQCGNFTCDREPDKYYRKQTFDAPDMSYKTYTVPRKV